MKNINNQFIQYLLSIGILSNETIEDFYKINSNYMTQSELQSKEEGEECFKESMTMSLIHYIYNLDGKRKRLLMLNIILQFIENSKHQTDQKLKGIILLMSHSHQFKPCKEISIKQRFNQWRSNNSLSSITSFQETEPANHHHHHHISTPIITEQNKTDNQHSLHSEHFDKLYNDHMIQSKKREIKTLEANTIEGNLTTFIPKINHPSKQLSKSKSSFHIRQKDFLIFKEKNKKDRSLYLETLESNECKFLPTINHSSFTKPRTANTSPVHLRLYTDSNIRQQKLKRKQREEGDLIKNNSNQNKSISIDLKRIHFLYNEYKLKKATNDGLIKEVDNDIGNTFKPYVPHDKYYNNINTSFFQREHEHLENKRIIKEIDDNAFILNRKQTQVGYQSYLPKNKNDVCNEVVLRLYQKPEVQGKKKMNFITSSTFAQSRNGVSINSTNLNQIEINK